MTYKPSFCQFGVNCILTLALSTSEILVFILHAGFRVTITAVVHMDHLPASVAGGTVWLDLLLQVQAPSVASV